MAATKFTAIYANNEGKIIEREIPGMKNLFEIIDIEDRFPVERVNNLLNDKE